MLISILFDFYQFTPIEGFAYEKWSYVNQDEKKKFLLNVLI